jgi:hypothetical protein
MISYFSFRITVVFRTQERLVRAKYKEAGDVLSNRNPVGCSTTLVPSIVPQLHPQGSHRGHNAYKRSQY